MPVRLVRHDRIDRRAPAPDDGYPLPPAKLRYRVHGALDGASFLAVGAACAHQLVGLLDEFDLTPPHGANVLDFGCGCGRVLRSMLHERPDWTYTGADIDAEAIAWSRNAYPGANFAVTPELPPTEFADSMFDLILVVSVFTHLDERFQDAWLGELRRIARPGGVVIATVAGPAAREVLTKSDREQLESVGIVYRAWRTGRSKVDGLPEFYQSAFHTRAYVETHWKLQGFDVLAYRSRAINNDQDAVISAQAGRLDGGRLYVAVRGQSARRGG